ncbi:MAG: hypothetical protein QM692_13400 [Thermomicrobiales bacterium]
MDASRFDRLSKSLAHGGNRRQLVQTLAGVAAAGLPALLSHQPASAAPGHGKRRGAHAESWHHKKVKYCVNGQTVKRLRRKQEKLLAAGATVGACPACVPTTCAALGATCGSASDGCGGTLQCGSCEAGLTCCAGQCVDTLSDESNCGTCGNVCQIDPPFFCARGTCIEPS